MNKLVYLEDESMFNKLVTIKPKSNYILRKASNTTDANRYKVLSQEKVDALSRITSQFMCDVDGVLLAGCIPLYDILNEPHIFLPAKGAIGEDGINALVVMNDRLDAYGIYGSMSFKLMCDDDNNVFIDFSTLYLVYGSGAALMLVDLFKDGILDISSIESITTEYQASFWHFNSTNKDLSSYVTQSLNIKFK